ncbi:MAG: hypothetical protein KJ571_05605 [Bacteroidetes bacterium]|nr:hypothetical protein [Bacteroidota bacterium]
MIKFEWRYHSKQLSFIAAAIVFFLSGIFATKGSYGGTDININSPYAITFFLNLLSLLSLFVLTIFSANALLRDHEYKMSELIYSTSISKFQFLFSRFAGIILAAFAMLCFAVSGMLFGLFWADAERLGVINLWNYIYPLFIFGVPNILFGASLLFTVSILTQSSTATYVTGVFIYILYFVASMLGNSPLMANSSPTGIENNLLHVLMDPYGIVGFLAQIKFWGVIEKNTQLVPLEGNLLINRIFWCCFAVTVFLIVYKIFSFKLIPARKQKQNNILEETTALIKYKPVSTNTSDFKLQWAAFITKSKLETKLIVKGIPFIVMMILWIGMIGITLSEELFSGIFDTSYYPSTGLIISTLLAAKIGVIFIIYYSAEIIWREHDVKISGLIGSYPVSNSIIFLSKCSALGILIIIFTALNILLGIVFQTANNYFRYELQYYFSLFYYSSLPLFLFAVLALFIQSLVSNKYLGMVLSALTIFIAMKGENLGIEHFLFRYANTPELMFSDFNAFGHYSSAFNWYMVYWSSFACLLILLSLLFGKNSKDISFKKQIKSLGIRFNKSYKISAAALLIIFITSGSYIFYQTNILNEYMTTEEMLQFQTEYEHKYKLYSSLPQPVITSVKSNVGLYPEERKYHVDGTYILQNKTEKIIDTVLIGIDHEVTSSKILFPKAKLVKQDDRYNYYLFILNNPMHPGQQTTMKFSIDVLKTGFENFNSENSILNNGSYIELEKYVPFIGYSDSYEIKNPSLRKKRGLPALNNKKKLEDYKPQNYNRINFETIISTSADQQIVTTGQLKKMWSKNKRNYFHYKEENPITFMFAIASANYKVLETLYNGIDIKLYYYDKHYYNTDKIINALKTSLNYFENNFGKYQFKEIKVAEIPQYRGAATAYPNTLFFSEKVGFLLDQSDTTKVDYTFLTVAHELSHQWWANQLEPADVEGSKVLTETLAQYSEAAAIENNSGKKYLRQYFSDILDVYLSSRGYSGEEPPLYKSVANRDAYIYYQKGALIMHAVKELLGEDRLNFALSNLRVNYFYTKFKPTTLNLLDELYSVSTADEQQLINEWFTKNIFYDLKINSAYSKTLADRSFEIKIKVAAKKYEIDKFGKKNIMPLNENFQIGFFSGYPENFDNADKLITCKKYKFNSASTVLIIILKQKPEFIVIDPINYIIDKNTADNIKKIEEIN